MRAVGYFALGPITAPDSLVDIELPRPSAAGRDLLVEVRAVSVNPVDYKVRSAPSISTRAIRNSRTAKEATPSRSNKH
jgi:NADPH:quinone reductase